MGADQRRKVEMLHNCTYGYAIGVFVNGKPMKKRGVDYTALQRGFMTVHKPAVSPSFLSTMTANAVSACRNTATALSADIIGQETPTVDEAAKPIYAFPANEAVVEAIRHTSDLSKAETPVYDTMANMPELTNGVSSSTTRWPTPSRTTRTPTRKTVTRLPISRSKSNFHAALWSPTQHDGVPPNR
jgi:hypothetical protein